eukprot:TRINITY_DN3972_c0_g1_i2.p1 TRINITY_DN3972_c0_g1~~TRINITY_DN3972_c0_g1_i2.p1  ORF type:complete len:172 (-),score=23.83 TRINITY_DN3972_c0_g1_i2:51-566(-)
MEVHNTTPTIRWKVIVVGEPTVKKSRFINRFLGPFDVERKAQIGIDFREKTIQVHDTTAVLQIWDIAGQERFSSMTRVYFKVAVGAIIVFSMDDRMTFESCIHWVEEIKKYTDPGIAIVIAGNTNPDAENVVTPEEGKEFAERHNLLFIETCVDTDFNVRETFQLVAEGRL